MSRLTDAVRDWIEQENIADPMELELGDTSYTSFTFKAQVEGSTYRVHLDCHDESDTFTAYVYLPEHVPEDRRPEVAILFASLNLHEVVLGNFDLDMEQGFVRYRLGVMLEDTELSMTMIENMARIAVQAMDRWGPTILAVAHGGAVADALALGRNGYGDAGKKIH